MTWSLEQVAAGRVRVTLRHSGWVAKGKTLDKHGKTWRGILADLKHQVETGDVSSKTKLSHAMMTTFMFALPAKTKTGNVHVPQ